MFNKVSQSPIIENGSISYDGFDTPVHLISPPKRTSALIHQTTNNQSNNVNTSKVRAERLFQVNEMEVTSVDYSQKPSNERYSIDMIYRDPVREADNDDNIQS